MYQMQVAHNNAYSHIYLYTPYTPGIYISSTRRAFVYCNELGRPLDNLATGGRGHFVEDVARVSTVWGWDYFKIL